MLRPSRRLLLYRYRSSRGFSRFPTSTEPDARMCCGRSGDTRRIMIAPKKGDCEEKCCGGESLSKDGNCGKANNLGAPPPSACPSRVYTSGASQDPRQGCVQAGGLQVLCRVWDPPLILSSSSPPLLLRLSLLDHKIQCHAPRHCMQHTQGKLTPGTESKFMGKFDQFRARPRSCQKPVGKIFTPETKKCAGPLPFFCCSASLLASLPRTPRPARPVLRRRILKRCVGSPTSLFWLPGDW